MMTLFDRSQLAACTTNRRNGSRSAACLCLLVAAGLSGCDRPTEQASAANVAGGTNDRSAGEVIENRPDLDIDAAAEMALTPLEAQLGAILMKVVSEEGMVRYRLFSEQELSSALDAYVDAIAIGSLPPESDINARKALWINAFNAIAMKMALAESRKEGFKTVNDVPGFFDQMPINVAGETTTLDGLVRNLRALKDPRIHSALVCAARGSPQLRNEPYTAGRIDLQLDEQSRAWLDDSVRNRLSPRGVLLSSVFERYEQDFSIEPYADVQGFVRKFSRPGGSIRDFLRNGVNPRISYLEFDWTLNDAGSR